MGEEATLSETSLRSNRWQATEKAGQMTEDEVKLSEGRSGATDKYIKEIDAVSERKIKEILNI